MNVFPTAAQAMSNAFVRLERGADKVQRGFAGASDADPGAGMVEMIEAKAQLKAGVATVRIADEMMKALIDIATRPRR